MADAVGLRYIHTHWQSKELTTAEWRFANVQSFKVRAEAGIPSSLSSANTINHADVSDHNPPS